MWRRGNSDRSRAERATWVCLGRRSGRLLFGFVALWGVLLLSFGFFSEHTFEDASQSSAHGHFGGLVSAALHKSMVRQGGVVRLERRLRGDGHAIAEDAKDAEPAIPTIPVEVIDFAPERAPPAAPTRPMVSHLPLGRRQEEANFGRPHAAQERDLRAPPLLVERGPQAGGAELGRQPHMGGTPPRLAPHPPEAPVEKLSPLSPTDNRPLPPPLPYSVEKPPTLVQRPPDRVEGRAVAASVVATTGAPNKGMEVAAKQPPGAVPIAARVAVSGRSMPKGDGARTNVTEIGRMAAVPLRASPTQGAVPVRPGIPPPSAAAGKTGPAAALAPVAASLRPNPSADSAVRTAEAAPSLRTGGHVDLPEADSHEHGSQAILDAAEGRYFLGVNVYGPNNQYYCFMESIKLARALRRTLVLQPFSEHYLDVWRKGHGDVVRYAKPVELTFDTSSLSETLGVRLATLNEFRAALQANNGTVDIYWSPRNSPPHYWNLTSRVITGQRLVPIPLARTVTNSTWKPTSLTPEWVDDSLGPEHVNATTLVLDSLFALNGDYRVSSRTLWHRSIHARDVHLEVVRALTHAPRIQRVATRIIRGMQRTWNTTAIIGIHYRQMDKGFTCPKSGICVGNAPFDELIVVLKSALFAARSAGSVAPDEFPPVYLASNRDEGQEDLFAALAEANFTRVRTHMVTPELGADNAYYDSLYEQEICMRSTVFVGSVGSTWSDRVLEMRVAKHIPHSWTNGHLPAPNASVDASLHWRLTCGYEYMGISHEYPTVLTLRCPPGTGVIQEILFASFGTPTGLCPASFAIDPGCHDKYSVARVTTLCKGVPVCRIPVTNNPKFEGAFGLRRCVFGGFALAVTAKCSLPSSF